ncbi:MAG: SpoIIE family protein phosphatase [Nannocystaceae bacterium]
MRDESGSLEVLQERVFQRRVRLAGQRVILGRSPDVDIVLNSSTASRRHAEIGRDTAGVWWVRDLDSVNGTEVNGTILKSRHRLMPGDIITIANYDLKYTLDVDTRGKPVKKPTRVTVTDADGVVQALGEFATPKLDATHLSSLTAFSGKLLATESADARMHTLCDLMVDNFYGLSAVVLRLRKIGLGHTGEDDDEPVVLCGPVPQRAQSPYISRSVLRAVTLDGSPVLASNAPGRPTNDLVAMSMMATQLSAVACPVGRTDGTIDVLYVTLPARFGTAEWLALSALASEQFEQAEATWAAREVAQEQQRLEDEMRRASAIQMNLVPPDFEFAGLDIGIGFEPSKFVGGDYVDAVRMRDGRIFLTVMDVCGKGLQAALIATGLHTTIHILNSLGIELAETIKILGQHLVRTLKGESFVTLCAVVFDPRTGGLEVVNCGGHPPPFIVAPNGRTREARVCDMVPLGFMEVDVEVARDQLAPGEMLAIYSDGLSELEDPHENLLESTGVARMLSEIYVDRQAGTPLAAKKHVSATSLVTALENRLNAYRQGVPAGDDASFLLAIRKSRTRPPPVFTPPSRK